MISFITHLTPLLLLIEKGVLALLIFLELAVIAMFLWRLRAYARVLGEPSKWMELLSKDLKRAMPPALVLTVEDEASISGRVVKTGMANPGLAPESLEKLFEVQESAEKRELEKGLSFLGSVGANAPFLGLTGTVIGILVAFDRFAASGGRGSTEVMTAISQSLTATALGLLVAIPAVVFYNVLRNKSKQILEQAREVRGVILARALHTAFNPEA